MIPCTIFENIDLGVGEGPFKKHLQFGDLVTLAEERGSHLFILYKSSQEEIRAEKLV